MKPVNLKLTSILEAKLAQKLAEIHRAGRTGKLDVPRSMLTLSNLLRIAAGVGLEELATMSDRKILQLFSASGLGRGRPMKAKRGAA